MPVSQGVAHADDAGQALRPPVGQRQAPALVEQADTGVVGHDPEVAPTGELDAARQAPAVHGGDRRLPRVEQSEPHRAGGVGVAVLEELLHPLEVGAGAERPVAGARDHQDLGGVVVPEGDDALGQFHGQVGVDVVVDLGAVEGEQRDLAVPLDEQLRHHSSPIVGGRPVRRRRSPGSNLPHGQFRARRTGERLARRSRRSGGSAG
jgi:hypothetical protein